MTLTTDQVYEAREKALAKLDEATSAYREEADRLTGTIRKLDAWLWENAPHSADSVVEEYVMLRDKRAAIKKDYENEDDYLKEQMEQRDAWLLVKLNEIGAESLRTNHGTAYKQLKTRSNCADWPLFWKYIAENNRFDLLEKRVSQGPINKMIEDGQELPPAINTHTEQVVTIRRS